MSNKSRTETTFSPPVPEARRWLDGVSFSTDQPLINVSQAAPVDPPPPALRRAIADAALSNDAAHLYGPVLGLPELREEVAKQWGHAYGGNITPDHVAITSGCNQAFSAAIAMLCGEKDEVLLPTPWYFNHKMWLDMAGVRTVPLSTGPDLLPEIANARALITPRTRAIVLVTPNNPGGVEYEGERVQAFYNLARNHNIALIVDETYRDFDSRSEAPHALFQQADWDKTLIHLYSFSKAFRLTGHRVGAMIASPARLAEAEKFLDTVAICPNQLGQIAALWGLQNLTEWLSEQRAEILDRKQAIADYFPLLAPLGWKLLGNGAYFAYLEHPFAESSPDLTKRMVAEIGVLALPGTMFVPKGDPSGAQQLRVAFANIDRAGIKTLIERLATLAPSSTTD